MSDHDALISVAARWERMYGELFVKAQRLSDENMRLRTAMQSLVDATNTDDKVCAAFYIPAGKSAQALRDALAAAAAVSSPGATEAGET